MGEIPGKNYAGHARKRARALDIHIAHKKNMKMHSKRTGAMLKSDIFKKASSAQRECT
jgi:hypothetical protein